MKTITLSVNLSAVLILTAVVVLAATPTKADTFGSGANMFEIEFVTIGNPGNAADTTGDPNPAGSVAETYRIGKFEISEDMINKANTLGGLGITHSILGPNKPAITISWFEATTFVNWLNTSSGSTPAYKFDGSNFQLWDPNDAVYDPNNLYRNSLATYFLPSTDEWYKAAYYNSVTNSYGDYPTANGLMPTAVSSGTTANTAVFAQTFFTGPADITLAGGLSPYGTMGQGGNVNEWEETDGDLVNDSTRSERGVRGGYWANASGSLSSSSRRRTNPSFWVNGHGFRVASIPEPSSVVLALAALGLAMSRRRAF